MRGKEGIYWTVLCLGLLIVLWNVTPATDVAISLSRSAIGERIIAGDPHDPIVIDGDDNFIEIASNEGWAGDGSEGDPFIIEGYDINRAGIAGHCISISNTRVNFTITACLLIGASINPGSGIYLDNVSYANIIKNEVYYNYHGIFLIDSDLNTISNNICNDNTGAGIYLLYSESNLVINNTCYSNTFGLHLEYSHHNTLANSDCYGHIDGIRLMASLSNTLSNNTCYTNTQNGIFMSAASDLNTLTNNTCYSSSSGIRISNSISSLLINNTCYSSDYGIRMSNSISNELINNTCYDNTESGIYLYNTNDTTLSKNTCYNCDYYGIFLDLSEFNSVVNNTCYLNTWIGIAIGRTNYTTIINNACYDNVYGISSISTEYNTLSENICYDNAIGIALGATFYNTLTKNICHDSDDFGIEIQAASGNTLTENTFYSNDFGIVFSDYSQYNIVYLNSIYSNGVGITLSSSPYNDLTYNIFSDNGVSAEDDYSGNTFDYNYYSDYVGIDINGDGIGDNPYSFTTNSDIHPLMYLPTPPTFLEEPDNTIMEYSFSSFEMKLNATAPTDITWWINNTLFIIDNQGMITSGFLLIGEYVLEVVASNIYGIGTSTIFSVTVADTTSPSWVIIPIDQTLEYNEALAYQVAASDLSGIDLWTLSDLVNFGIDEYGVITNNTALSPGTYPLTVSVFDTYDNELEKAITITVNEPEEDTTPPEWRTITISQSFDYGEPVEIQVEAWDESGIHHLWLNNTDLFTIDAHGIITNSSTLEPGVYNLEVRAYDYNDNFCSANIVLTVLEPEVVPIVTVTTTITTTITTTVTITITVPTTNETSGPTRVNPVLTLTLGAGIGGAVVLILFVLFLKRSTTK